MHVGTAEMSSYYKSAKHLFSISAITLVWAGKELFADGCWFPSYALSSSSLMDMLSEITYSNAHPEPSTDIVNIYWGLSMHKVLSVLVRYMYYFAHNQVGRSITLSTYRWRNWSTEMLSNLLKVN